MREVLFCDIDDAAQQLCRHQYTLKSLLPIQ